MTVAGGNNGIVAGMLLTACVFMVWTYAPSFQRQPSPVAGLSTLKSLARNQSGVTGAPTRASTSHVRLSQPGAEATSTSGPAVAVDDLGIHLAQAETGWPEPPKPWMTALCPGAVKH